MGTVAFDLTRTNARIYADEAALVNTFRRLKRSLLNMPKKLGLIYEKKEVGVHDITKEKMIEAIKNEPDSERRRELIRATELFAGII